MWKRLTVRLAAAGRYMGSGLLLAAALAFMGIHIWVSATRDLTRLETSFFTTGTLALGLWSAAVWGRRSGEAAIQPHARAALRRVVTLEGGLQRLSEDVRRARRGMNALFDNEKGDAAALYVGKVAEDSMNLLGAVVREQIAQAKDAIADWGDILPEEAARLKEQYDLADRVRDLEARLAVAAAQEAELRMTGKHTEVRAKEAETRAQQLEREVAAAQKQLADLSARSRVSIATRAAPEATAHVSVPKTAPVPKGFPAKGALIDKLLSDQRITDNVLRFTMPTPTCIVCGIGGGFLDSGTTCVACGQWACGRHITNPEKDADGPRCVPCWEKERKKPGVKETPPQSFGS